MKNIDPIIREYLLLNGSLDYEDLQGILTLVSECNESQLEIWKERLKELLLKYLELQEINDIDFTERIINIANLKKHLLAFEEHFGKPSLKDVIRVTKMSKLKVKYILEKKYVTPGGIKDAIDDYVVGQDDYLDKLSLNFYTYCLRMFDQEFYKDIPRANLLVYGPTGVGKTFAIQVLADIFEVNVGIVNCNSLVQEGIVGVNISDVFTEIYVKNNNSEEAVMQSIVFFDEFDKLFLSGSYNSRILNEILSIIDDNGSVVFKNKKENYNFENIRLSTKNMMFVFSGVFEGLKRVVEKKRNISSLGFDKRSFIGENDFYEYVEPSDFKKLNIRSEILGRINDYAYVKDLSTEMIEDILLRSESSPIKPYKRYFESHGIELELLTEGAKELSSYVDENKSGVRGLKSLLWQILSDEMGLAGDEVLISKKIFIDKLFIEKKLKEDSDE